IVHHLSRPFSPILYWLILTRGKHDLVIIHAGAGVLHHIIYCVLAAHHVLIFRKDASVIASFPLQIFAAVLGVFHVRSQTGCGGLSIPPHIAAPFSYHVLITSLVGFCFIWP